MKESWSTKNDRTSQKFWELAVEKGFSNTTIAKKCGVTPTEVQNWVYKGVPGWAIEKLISQ